jgi:sugar fermentation stimulation protein A
MIFPEPLQSGILIKRYKRFLTDIRLQNDDQITIFCPNTGSLMGCNTPDSKVWFSKAENTERKYPHTWEIIEIDGHRIGINTHIANHLVEEAIVNGTINELAGYPHLKKEVKYGKNSRIDILLSDENQTNKCYVEVKNVTLGKENIGYFPDAVTTRGTKHLQELMQMKQDGHRAVLVFCVQHTGVNQVKAAEFIDPTYSQTLQEAHKGGVEVLAYQAHISESEIKLHTSLPVII